MKIERIGSEDLIKSLKSGTDYLEMNYRILDNLNVFPVPDGDTGVNMVFTMKPGIEAILKEECSTILDISKLINKYVIKNSRGNSGFILARFFHGFFQVVEKCDSITPDTLSQSFENGSYLSRTALLTPVEGTMITIISSMADSMAGLESNNILDYFDEALKSAMKSIFETPKLLPILAKAGVVDAGGLGFIFVIEGMMRGLLDKENIKEDEDTYRFEPDLSIKDEVKEKLNFRFCTELVVKNENNLPADDIREFLHKNGDSIALINDDLIIKLHIHTNEPDKIIEEVKCFGNIVQSKVDDMQEQVSRTLSAVKEHEEFSILSIMPGSGFKAIFGELGVTDFIEYSDNLPSSGDILESIEKIENNNIIILPNDKNIIPAVTLAIDNTDKNVSFLPTKNVIQGITVMYGFNDIDSSQENIKNMADSIEFAICLNVYKSVKDSTFGEVQIKENDFFVVNGEEVLSTGGSLSANVLEALKKIDLSDKGSVSFYYNDEFDISLFGAIEACIKELNEIIEIENFFGGQKKSILIISIE